MTHAYMMPDNKTFFPGLYLHHQGENVFTEKQEPVVLTLAMSFMGASLSNS